MVPPVDPEGPGETETPSEPEMPVDPGDGEEGQDGEPTVAPPVETDDPALDPGEPVVCQEPGSESPDGSDETDVTTPADAEGSPTATEAPSALGDPPVADPEALPVTGGRLSAVVIALVLTLVACGGALVVWGRRRRTES